LLSACLEDPDCIITSSNLVKIDFKEDAETSKSIEVTKITVSGSDTEFYKGKTVSSVQLPLNPAMEETVFTFEIKGATSKTINLTYARTTTLISPTCGVFIEYKDLLADTTFDSLTVINNRLSTNVSTNIEVFID
jgi:hypothetical protein